MAANIPWRLSRGLRNNNPGNLNYVGQSGASMETGVDNPRFAAFPTMQDGVNALDNQLGLYFKRGLNTPRKIAHTYAPKGDGDNDPDAYAMHLAQANGMTDPDAPLADSPQTRQNLRSAIIAHETPDFGQAAPGDAPQGMTDDGQVDPQHSADDLNGYMQGMQEKPLEDPKAPAPIKDEDGIAKPGLQGGLQFLMDLGAGAGQGDTWASSLAGGLRNSEEQDERRASRSADIARANADTLTQNNSQRIQSAGVRNAQREYGVNLAKSVADFARQTGTRPSTVMALMAGKLNPMDARNLNNAQSPEVQMDRARMAQMNEPTFSAPSRWVKQNQDGSITSGVLQGNDKGGIKFTSSDGTTSDGLPAGFVPDADGSVKWQNKQNVANQSKEADEQTADDGQRQIVGNILNINPLAGAGGSFSDRAGRYIGKLAGLDSQASVDALNKNLSALQVEGMNMYRGRPDAAAQSAALASSPDISQRPELIQMVGMQKMRNLDARDEARRAWQDFKDQNPNTTHDSRAWQSQYYHAHQPALVTLDEARKDLASRQAALQHMQGQTQQGAAPTPSQPKAFNVNGMTFGYTR